MWPALGKSDKPTLDYVLKKWSRRESILLLEVVSTGTIGMVGTTMSTDGGHGVTMLLCCCGP